ncbi:DEAD/DEAH box helicase family protein [Vallitalea guaymasensis]|uniref:DEAD/DEAH box helicase family protein n=1 Tax=Vallitalea guaymasensis TaxID=1185412 RepID=UPI000DE25899|nr:hypothetical protein [Vallitalea guaymasensis]
MKILLPLKISNNNKVVLISDEAHHLNALTKSKLTKGEEEDRTSWESTVMNILNSNIDNILLEYTATAELDNPVVKEKYNDKVIYRYSLREFREDKYSKEVKVLRSDANTKNRLLQALVVSQYRKKIAQHSGLLLKPVVLIKSKSIQMSKNIFKEFNEWINNLKKEDLESISHVEGNNIINKAFDYFYSINVSVENLVHELKEDFSDEKRLIVNSKQDSEEKQIVVNTLEDQTNPVRIIFAVDMLNEGWDVLNLFDIVRVDETRGSKATTTKEAQLIGRGARYYPFQLNDHQDLYRRKYDEDIENNLRILEELYYHSINNVKYISDLKTQLQESGIIPKNSTKIKLELKDSFKTSSFYTNGVLFVNEKIRNDRMNIFSLKDMEINDETYTFTLRTGKISEFAIFTDNEVVDFQGDLKEIREKVKCIDRHIVRKALMRNQFFYFDNLKTYFPHLLSLDEFIASEKYVGNMEIRILSQYASINQLSGIELLGILTEFANKIKKSIVKGSREFRGSKTFIPKAINKIDFDRTMNITDAGGEQEFGRPMSRSINSDLQLDLTDKDWYIYKENYGTSEEKSLVKFIHFAYDKLQEKYSDIYLIRNQKIFQLYRFSDGKAFEPDFVMFAKRIDGDITLYYQLFIEPKGDNLLKADEWKEQALKEIEEEYNLSIEVENRDYIIYSMPFFNSNNTERIFREEFSLKMGIE